eukprot:4033428-Pyramimonas_sp.AAC.1
MLLLVAPRRPQLAMQSQNWLEVGVLFSTTSLQDTFPVHLSSLAPHPPRPQWDDGPQSIREIAFSR